VRERATAGTPVRHAAAALARQAVLPTLAALVVIALLVGRNGTNLPAEDLALLLVVTVPHSVVTAWQDRTDLHDRRVPGAKRAFAGRVKP
jgi:hypothetical protein